MRLPGDNALRPSVNQPRMTQREGPRILGFEQPGIVARGNPRRLGGLTRAEQRAHQIGADPLGDLGIDRLRLHPRIDRAQPRQRLVRAPQREGALRRITLRAEAVGAALALILGEDRRGLLEQRNGIGIAFALEVDRSEQMQPIAKEQAVRPLVLALQFEAAGHVAGRLERAAGARQDDRQHLQRTGIAGMGGVNMGHRPLHRDAGVAFGLVHPPGPPQNPGIAVIGTDGVGIVRSEEPLAGIEAGLLVAQRLVDPAQLQEHLREREFEIRARHHRPAADLLGRQGGKGGHVVGMALFERCDGSVGLARHGEQGAQQRHALAAHRQRVGVAIGKRRQPALDPRPRLGVAAENVELRADADIGAGDLWVIGRDPARRSGHRLPRSHHPLGTLGVGLVQFEDGVGLFEQPLHLRLARRVGSRQRRGRNGEQQRQCQGTGGKAETAAPMASCDHDFPPVRRECIGRRQSKTM